MYKNVAIQDENGVQQHFDVSQIKAREINRWEGWICSAGTNVLHITRDGDVYAGTCKVGGKLGDIYTGWKDVTGWLICSEDRCNCGTQIKIPKHKPGFMKALGTNTGAATGEIDPEAQAFVDHIGPLDLHIQWSLGRRCNYDCSYCPVGDWGIHNDYEEHKPLEILLETVDKLHRWANGRTMMFCFSGGEPTIHPGFAAMCRHIKALGHKVHVTTNGSHGPRFWKKLCEVIDYALVSVHFEFTPIPVLIKNLAVMMEHKKQSDTFFHIGLQIMTKPEDWDRAMELIQGLRDTDENFLELVETHMTALRKMLGVDQTLMEYTPEQIAQFGVVTE